MQNFYLTKDIFQIWIHVEVSHAKMVVVVKITALVITVSVRGVIMVNIVKKVNIVTIGHWSQEI